MFESYLLPIIIFAVLGLLAGILLTVASKIFAVKTDERVEQINDALPQANCGACGFAGCADYASAIIENGASPNLCKPGGAEISSKINNIIGVDGNKFIPEIAVVQCQGTCTAVSKRFEFKGIDSCSAAKRFYGGNISCTYGCLGYGDCAEICPENAISISDGVAQVNDNCITCGKCIKACPNNIISIKPSESIIDVKCSSKDNGKTTRTVCKNGCIGCRICEKKCVIGAIKVNDFLASIDYNICTGCGACYEACPTGAIINILNK